MWLYRLWKHDNPVGWLLAGWVVFVVVIFTGLLLGLVSTSAEQVMIDQCQVDCSPQAPVVVNGHCYCDHRFELAPEPYRAGP